MLRNTMWSSAIAFALVSVPAATLAQQPADMTDAAYVAKVMTGAPAAVVKGSTIVRMNPNGSIKTIQSGNNGFTCMLLDATPGCADRNAMGWMRAYMMKATPPANVGFMYMLAGDDGASVTDPFARAATSTNHWVKSGPHVMLVGPSVQSMGYPMTPNADTSKPYVMWANTPYAHLMIPVTTQP